MSDETPTNGTVDGEAPAQEEIIAVSAAEETSFSWLKPHPIFVIVLVGPEEHPFGLQKDFLCHRSEFFRNHFAQRDKDDNADHDDAVERLVKLPAFSADVFGLAQQFLYTGAVLADEARLPSYECLVRLWNLAHELGIDGLCDKTLEAMSECRRLTDRIPATPLLIQAWRDSPEGSSIRRLLLSWAAEYMRASDTRADFAKSLPQEVLSELVVAMSAIDVLPSTDNSSSKDDSINSNKNNRRDSKKSSHDSGGSREPTSMSPPRPPLRKSVHYLDVTSDDDNDAGPNGIKKSKRANGLVVLGDESQSKTGRAALPKAPRRRPSAAYLNNRMFSTAQKMEFCADLLNRMLSGPGFWTRLVGPFKEPVDPVEDGVPDYLAKVKRPMDLGSIKSKMDRGGYANEDEFVNDMRQIFNNCFTYWAKGDPMWVAGEKLQRSFEDKYSHMNKWIAKMGGDEAE